MAKSGMQWSGIEKMQSNIKTYGNKVEDVPLKLGQYYAPQMETDAKNEAKWIDRTGNARAGLNARVWQENGGNTTIIQLAYGVFYGRFLELRWQGRYAIILPILQRYYPQVGASLRAALGAK